MYEKQWHRNWFVSLSTYVRDLVINLLPVRRLPAFLTSVLYKQRVDFTFLVHPRRSEDIFVALPFLVPLRKLMTKSSFLRRVLNMMPFVLARIRTPLGAEGVVISSLFMPEFLMHQRRRTLMEAKRMVKLSTKLSHKGTFIGLGGWWPIVTSRGKFVEKYARDIDASVTNGHTVTILSIVMMLKRMFEIAGVPFQHARVAIIGAGKIGAQVAGILAAEGVHTISLLDINENKLTGLKASLTAMGKGSSINIFNVNSCRDTPMLHILSQHHAAVCATSNTRGIIKSHDLPEHFVIIDDSRPEGISRDVTTETKIILEGGMIRVPGLWTDYNYGMGIDENVFGCLAETIILSAEKGIKLRPTVGDIDMENLYHIWEFCKQHDIRVGDLKCREQTIPDRTLAHIIQTRESILNDQPHEFLRA